MAVIVKRPEALEDVLDIWLSIVPDGERRADEVVRRIDAGMARCAEHPLIGRSRDDLLPGLRGFIVVPFIIFYVPIDDGIRVVRVLHGARHLPELFGQDGN